MGDERQVKNVRSATKVGETHEMALSPAAMQPEPGDTKSTMKTLTCTVTRRPAQYAARGAALVMESMK